MAAALFYMDIEDIHVYKSLGTGIYYTNNAESAHSQGIELEFAYRLIDAEYDTYDAMDGLKEGGC